MALDDAAASDALSMHTIADQADAYATQEQEDADFALALQFEEEESRDLARAQDQAPYRGEENAPVQSENFTPYRDDPTAEGDDTLEDLPPYRDDVHDAAIDDENSPQTQDATPTRRRWSRLSASIRKLSSRKLFGRKHFGRKPHNTPLCGVIAIVIFLCGFIAVSIGVLVHKHARSDKQQAFKNSGSGNYRLKLSGLYPDLHEGASEECKEAWEDKASPLYCEEEILWTAWDGGDAEEVKRVGLDPWGYSKYVCLKACLSDMERLESSLATSCNQRTDRFDIESYWKKKPAYFEKRELQEGPLEALRQLVKRHHRECAVPPRRQSTEWGTCAAEVWMKWGVVDGDNEMTMAGLEQFVAATSEKKIIEGGLKSGEVDMGDKKKKAYNITEPQRLIGPGPGETECGFCTRNWLERKMRSFEYGGMIDPVTGKGLGLAEFDDRMTQIIQRCEKPEAQKMLDRVHNEWTQFGLWCQNKPCHEDHGVSEELRPLLNGMRYDDWPLPELRKMQGYRGAPKQALSALHDGLLSLPCSIWFSEDAALREVIPYQNRVSHMCSSRCRNAVDRVQQQHGAKFTGATRDVPPFNIFIFWQMAVENLDKICLTSHPNAIVKPSEQFCAPGYAALGHPEYIFADSEPVKPDIVSSFSAKIDQLERSLPAHIPSMEDDPDRKRVLDRIMAESPCNACAGNLLVGSSWTTKTRISEFLDDESIDGREYTLVAKQFFTTCFRLVGYELTRQQKLEFWKRVGLDRYD